MSLKKCKCGAVIERGEKICVVCDRPIVSVKKKLWWKWWEKPKPKPRATSPRVSDWTIESETIQYQPESVVVPKPKPNDFKGDIVRWISYWLVSAFWGLCHDLVDAVGQWFYRQWKAVYQAISIRAFQDMDLNMPKSTPEE